MLWQFDQVELNRKSETEGGALSGAFAFHPDPASVNFNELAGKCQPQSGAAVLSSLFIFHLAEWLEYACHIIFLDADAGILHADFNFPTKAVCLARTFTRCVCDYSGL